MRYWVISPNVGGPNASRESLRTWKELTRKYKAAFMGWPAGGKGDTKGLGRKFAKDYGGEEITILIAHRESWKWILVAVGKVASQAKRDDGKIAQKYGREYGFGTYRKLKPFVSLQDGPAASRLSLERTSPDRLTNIVALVELKPESLPADRRLCERLTAIIRREDEDNGAERTTGERDAALEAQEARAGYQSNPKVRKAVEVHAMEKAKRHYGGLGFQWEDTSKHHPFDLKCSKGESLIYVEVKGTQNSGGEIILTDGELRHMEDNRHWCQLFLLKCIDVTGRSNPKASGGVQSIFTANDVLKARRHPTQYRVVLLGA